MRKKISSDRKLAFRSAEGGARTQKGIAGERWKAATFFAAIPDVFGISSIDKVQTAIAPRRLNNIITVVVIRSRRIGLPGLWDSDCGLKVH
jgi:hypothetical protein